MNIGQTEMRNPSVFCVFYVCVSNSLCYAPFIVSSQLG